MAPMFQRNLGKSFDNPLRGLDPDGLHLRGGDHLSGKLPYSQRQNYFLIFWQGMLIISQQKWTDLKKKLLQKGYEQLSEKIGQLKMLAPDGKQRSLAEHERTLRHRLANQ